MGEKPKRMVTVTPVEGHRVTDPRGRLVEQPTEVEWSMHWARLEHLKSITVDRGGKAAKRSTKKSEA
ncbi:MAG: hypothetical protein JJ863_21380 [Deltaproteobacteria bacterium]|nr:hypothetical protein [Deltaproteobacteria bacterium]